MGSHSKYIALLIWLVLASFLAGAQNQVRITTNVLPPYSPYIQDYPGTGNRVQVFISNLSRKPLSVRLLGKLEGDNGVVIRTSPNYRPLQPLQLQATDVNRLITRAELEGLFDLNQIEVTGMDKNLLYRGLPLPEGNYQLCVQAFDNATVRPISAEFPMGCSGLIPVRIIEPPILIFPQADMQVNANIPQTQLFTWTAPVGILPTQVDYTLRIVELPALDVDPNVFIDAVALPKSGIEVKNLKTTTFLYGPAHPPLQLGRRYAWRVQAKPVNSRLNFLNEGKSPVQAFTYGKTPGGPLIPGMEIAQTPLTIIPGLAAAAADSTKKEKTLLAYKLPANCSCKAPVNENDKVDNSGVLKTRKATIAGFQMELLQNVKEEKGTLSGTGMIPVPMINNSYVKLRVKLFDVQCNASGQVIGGFVRAIYKNGAPGFTPDYDKPEMPAIEMSPATMQNLSGFFETAKDQVVSSLSNSAKSVGFELPLGIDKTFGPINTVIAITNMTFTPDQAVFDANTWVKTPSAMVSGIPLSGYNMCFTPEKPCGEGVLYLADKMQLSPFFALKGAEGAPSSGPFAGPDTTVVTHVIFDDKGFKQMRVHGLLTPPGLVDAQTKGPVEISVNAGLVNFQNWTAQLSFPKFYVTGLPEFKFSMQPGKPALYDHSESATPANLPEGYLEGADVNLWQGLYFPEIAMELPAFIKNANSQSITLGIKDMISDNNGFSGKAFIKDDILKIGDGSLDSWYYSIDEISVSFLKSTFQKSEMKGRMVLPVFKGPGDASSQLPYTCTLSKEDSNGGLNVQFVAKPAEAMKVDIWQASLTLKDVSNVMVTYNGNNGVEAKADLSGSMDIDAKYFTIPAAQFDNLVMSSKAPYFSIGKLHMGFASPQKMMEDFPLTLKTAELVKDPNDVTRFGFKFAGGIDLMNGGGQGLSADAGATLYFQAALSNGRPDWKFGGVTPDEASVDGDVGPLHFKGSVHFYDEDAKYGNGLEGKLDMALKTGPSAAVGGMVAARFGKVDGYNYWYIGGKVDIGAAGIPFVGPLVFRSFGGGLYSNVTKSYDAQLNPVYSPQQGQRGFEALVGVGLVTPDILTAEGTVSMQLNDDFSVSQMSLDVNAWLLGPTSSGALATGKQTLFYNFDEEIFSGQLTFEAAHKVPLISITASLPGSIDINGKTGKWFFSLGKTEERAVMNINIAGLGSMDFGSYFMVGNYNPTGVSLPPTPYGFEERPGIINELGYKNKLGPVFGENSGLLAFGAGYKFGADFGVGPFHLRYKGAIGFDLALARATDPCNGSIPGINGWYAQGQLYAYMGFALDIDVDTWVYEGTITVAELEAAALLRGGLMNPIWMNGHILLKYKVLGGLVKGKVNMEFWYNKDLRCEPAYSPPNPFAGQPLIASIGPSGTGEKVSILSPYYAEFNYPVESDLIIDLEIPEGQKVEAGTQGDISQSADGTQILHREFQLKYKKGFVAVPTSISPKYATCEQDNSGRYSYGRNEEGDPNYSVTFYRNTALLPESNYDLSIDLQVHIRDKGKLVPYLFKKQTVEQTEKVSFTTGPCLSVFSKGTSDTDIILTSYPYEGQRYFMKGEAAETFIKLKSNLSCCVSDLNEDNDFTLNARFTPLDGLSFADQTASVLVTKATFSKDRVVYALPAAMKNKTLYRFELVRIPKPEFVKAQFAEMQKMKESAKKILTANIYVAQKGGKVDFTGAGYQSNYSDPFKGQGNNLYGPVNKKHEQYVADYTVIASVDYDKIAKSYGTDYKITAGTEKFLNTGKMTIQELAGTKTNIKEEEAFAKKLETTIYKYYFKTSQFNTLAEKMAAVQFPAADPSLQGTFGDMLIGKMTSKEGFDSYEMTSTLLSGYTYLPPLVMLRADPNSEWFKENAEMLAQLLTRFSAYYYSLAGYDARPFETKEQAVNLFMRQLMHFNSMYDKVQAPFENEEIMQLIPTEKKKFKK